MFCMTDESCTSYLLDFVYPAAPGTEDIEKKVL